MYENLDAEFHALVSMPMRDIFKGLQMFEEEPKAYWDHIVATFGHEFFLPVIEKLYGHLFCNDVKR